MEEKAKFNKTAYDNAFIAKTYDRINLTVSKGKKDYIKSHADKRGESVNGFINRAIGEAMGEAPPENAAKVGDIKTAQNAAGAPQAFGCQITRVNGRNGADAFRMAPNSSILLMDENDPIVWMKQTDGAGYATVTPYTVSPYQAAPPVDVSSLEERVKRLEDTINGKSNDANADGKRKPKAE